MAYLFFYGSIAVLWVIFIIINFRKPIKLPHVIIGIAAMAYSLFYEIILGEYYNLYYYIKKEASPLYIALAGILVYPILNMIYTHFLPKNKIPVLLYTGAWIIGMLVFEYLSLLTKTVVFVRWRMFPWSLLTYIVTYLWVYYFYSYLNKKIDT